MRLAVAASTFVFGACQSASQPEIIDLGEIPSARDIGICPAEDEGFRYRGVSCFDGVQVVPLGSWHGEMTGAAPRAMSVTNGGLEATVIMRSFGAISDGSNLPLVPSAEFELQGCDDVDRLDVSSLTEGVDAHLEHSAVVGTGLRFEGGRETPTPPFAYGSVSLAGSRLAQHPLGEVTLKFDGRSAGCDAMITVPARYLDALEQWARASNDDDTRRRAEMNK